MNLYKVSKYNPDLISENGISPEWTSISDTWTKDNDTYVPSEEYLNVENQYISLILEVLDLNNLDYAVINAFNISAGYDYSDLTFNSIMDIMENIYVGKKINIQEFTLLIKSTLRQGIIGCSFKMERFHLYFGFDYYMELGSEKLLDIKPIEATYPNVFVEKKDWSYYNPDDYDPDDYIKTTKDKIYYYSLCYLDHDPNVFSHLKWEINDENQKIPSEQYLALESEWLDIIHSLIEANHISYLQVDELDVHPHNDYIDIDFHGASKEVYSISNDTTLAPREILIYLKLMLRGEMNCRLEAYNFFIHVVDKFNIYIGCTNKIDLNDFKLNHPNITITPDISPFLKKNNYYQSGEKEWLYIKEFKDYVGIDMGLIPYD